jgi:predicted DNA binding protein
VSVVATFDVRATDFELGDAVTRGLGVCASFEPVVPLGRPVAAYLRSSDCAARDLAAVLRAVDGVASVRAVGTEGGQALVRFEMADDADGPLGALSGSDAAVLAGRGDPDTWTFRLRFVDRDDLSDFYHAVVDTGIPLSLANVQNRAARVDGGSGLDLTETQRETLEVALEEGYFEIPRGITLAALADELGVSDTAVSQRLRRGLRALLVSTLSTTTDGGR